MIKEEAVSYFKSLGLRTFDLSPDGRRAVAGFSDHVIRVFLIGEEGLLSTWKLEHELSEHTQEITSTRWSSQNAILSTSVDRNAIVWVPDPKLNSWKKQLCIIDNKKAITCSDWSPNGLKFAVGTACKSIFLGYWSKELNCWQSYQLERCKSTVLAVKFHPSGRAVGGCSADHTFRLLSCVVEGGSLEDKTYRGHFSDLQSVEQELFYDKDDKKVMAESWVNGCVFSPDGTKVLLLPHCNMVLEVDLPTKVVKTYDWLHLPLLCGVWLPEGVFLAGFNRKVAVLSGGEFRFLQKNLMTQISVKSKKGHVSRIASMYEKKVLTNMSELGKSAKEELQLACHANTVLGAVVSPSSGRLFTYDINGIVHVWPTKQ